MTSGSVTPARSDTLPVSGATLYYEVRGSGPVLLLIPGGPTDASGFAEIATALADRYTVVTYDPRGYARSQLVGPPEASDGIEVFVNDARQLLAAVGGEPAYVFGTSNGAITGLELTARHSSQVRTLVAHEPPITELLPDRERHRELGREVYDTYQREGVGAAMTKFMAGIGGNGAEADDSVEPAEPADPAEEETEEDLEDMAQFYANLESFFGVMWQPLIGYSPDTAKLRACDSQIVVAVGDGSAAEEVAYQAAVALADRLACAPVGLPGDHGGYADDPNRFADRLDEVLRQQGR